MRTLYLARRLGVRAKGFGVAGLVVVLSGLAAAPSAFGRAQSVTDPVDGVDRSVDIVSASIKPSGKTLWLTVRTAGPIGGSPAPVPVIGTRGASGMFTDRYIVQPDGVFDTASLAQTGETKVKRLGTHTLRYGFTRASVGNLRRFTWYWQTFLEGSLSDTTRLLSFRP
jgi:hypothetical protein